MKIALLADSVSLVVCYDCKAPFSMKAPYFHPSGPNPFRLLVAQARLHPLLRDRCSNAPATLPFWCLAIDTEYDRAKVPPYNGNDPRPPLVV